MNRLQRRLLVPVLLAGLLAVSVSLLPSTEAGRKKRSEQPDVVVVQHILIGFKRSVPGKKLDRSKREAAALAEELFARANEPDTDFAALVDEYTDDRSPGIYTLTNEGAPLRGDAYKRSDMALHFGDVAFDLEVGEIGMAEYNGAHSPYGWHIIKRLE